MTAPSSPRRSNSARPSAQIEHLTLETGWFRQLRFAPDGKLVGASQASELLVLNSGTWTPLFSPLIGHEGLIKDLEVSADGSLIVSSGSDGLISMWEVATGELAQSFPVQSTSVQNVEFLDDRHLVVTGMHDPAFILTLDLDELTEIARSRITRTLTEQKCRTYLHVERCPPG